MLKRKSVLFFTFSLLSLLLQCSDNSIRSIGGQLDEPFLLSLDQSARIETESIEIVFSQIVSENRCPASEECHTGDMAEISLRVRFGEDRSSNIKLAILSNPSPDDVELLAVEAFGYRFKLLQLDGPTQIVANDLSTYSAQIQVSLADPSSSRFLDSVQVRDLPPESITRLALHISSIRVAYDTLHIKVEYGGGCNIHLIRAIMSPSTFLESEPLQANIYLRHVSGRDYCAGVISEERRFSLIPLKHKLLSQYGAARTIQLNVSSYSGLSGTQKHVVYYGTPPQPLNHPPNIIDLDNQSVDAASILKLRVIAGDPDLTTPTISANSLPDFSTFVDFDNGQAELTLAPQASDVGQYAVEFIASDGLAADTELVEITVAPENFAPIISAPDSVQVAEGDSLFLVINASDPNGTTPTIWISNIPENLTFLDRADGSASIVFRPDFFQSGTYPLSIVASDHSLSTSVLLIVKVANTDRPPVLAVPDSLHAWFGYAQSFDFSASDLDFEAVSIRGLSLPVFATLFDNGNSTATLGISADSSQEGTYAVPMIASDGELEDTAVVTLVVLGEFPGITFDPVPPQTIREGDTLRFELYAHSRLNPNPSIRRAQSSYVPLLGRSEITALGNGRALYSYAPAFTEAGIKTFRFRGWDGQYENFIDVTVEVLEAGNQLPTFGVLTEYIGATVGQTLEFIIAPGDKDDSSLTLSAAPLPIGATFITTASNRGQLKFTPNLAQVGTHTIKFQAEDDKGMIATHELKIMVDSLHSSPGPLMPPEIGNYWVYEHLFQSSTSAPGYDWLDERFDRGSYSAYRAIDSSSVVDRIEKVSRLWSILSAAIEPLSQRFSTRNDTLIFEPSTIWQKYFFPNYRNDTTLSWIRIRKVDITTPVGSFKDAVEYSWGATIFSNEDFKVTFVPGIGIVEATQYVSPASPMPCEYSFCTTVRNVVKLVRYRVAD